MTPTYIVAVDGLDSIRLMKSIGPKVARNALKAVNKTTRDGRVIVSRAIQAQVNFTPSYLGPKAGRLTAVPATTVDKIEGRIVARRRATSLARFTKQKPLQPGQRRRKGISVTVKKGGQARFLADAFVIPLRAGKDGPLSNLGLAIRSDTKPAGAYKPQRLGKNLWLLYGPSVSQIMHSARNARGGVADEVAPGLAAKLEAEFNRLMDLK